MASLVRINKTESRRQNIRQTLISCDVDPESSATIRFEARLSRRPKLARITFAAERASSVREFNDTGEAKTQPSTRMRLLSHRNLPAKLPRPLGSALALV